MGGAVWRWLRAEFFTDFGDWGAKCLCFAAGADAPAYRRAGAVLRAVRCCFDHRRGCRVGTAFGAMAGIG